MPRAFERAFYAYCSGGSNDGERRELYKKRRRVVLAVSMRDSRMPSMTADWVCPCSSAISQKTIAY